MGGDIGKFFGAMMVLVTSGLLLYGGMTVIAILRRRLDKPAPSNALNPDEVELVRNQLAETEQLRARLSELEERVDFTERLLERARSEKQLDAGGR